jgi:hypothetical protein
MAFGFSVFCWASGQEDREAWESSIQGQGYGSYVGPVIAEPKVFENPLAGKKEEELLLLYRVEAEFRKKNISRIKAHNKKLSGQDKKPYLDFLARRKERALGCLDFSFGRISAVMDAYMKASEPAEQYKQINKLLEAKPASKQLIECIDALSPRLDPHGVLTSGLLLDKDRGGQTRLKPTIDTEGKVLIIAPMVLSAWPGRNDAPARVIDPGDGPWLVGAAYTYEKKLSRHYQAWKRQKEISFTRYLKERRSNFTHLLLVDKQGQALGWISLDDCAFFTRREPAAIRFGKEVYRKGVAELVHGFWESPPAINPERPGKIRIYDSIMRVYGVMAGPVRYGLPYEGHVDYLDRIDDFVFNVRARSSSLMTLGVGHRLNAKGRKRFRSEHVKIRRDEKGQYLLYSSRKVSLEQVLDYLKKPMQRDR